MKDTTQAPPAAIKAPAGQDVLPGQGVLPEQRELLGQADLWSSQATNGSKREDRASARVPPVVTSQAPPGNHEPGYSYRGYQYAKTQATIGSPANDMVTVCADSGCGMSLIDRQFLLRYSPTTTISTMPTDMRVRGIGQKLHNANQFAKVDFYFPTTNGCVAHFLREVHIVDGLEANALLGSDIIYPEGWVLDLPNEEAVLTRNLGLRIKLQVVRQDKIRRTVFTKDKVTIPAQHRATVEIAGPKGKPLDLPDRDFLFEPTNQAVTLFASIVNSATTRVVVQNSSDLPMTLSKFTKLGTIGDDDIGGYFATPQENEPLAAKSKRNTWKRSMFKGLLAAAAAVQVTTSSATVNHATETPLQVTQAHAASGKLIDSVLTGLPPDRSEGEVHLSNGITVYGDLSTVDKVEQVATKFASLWADTGQQVNMPKNEYMEIPLVDNWEHIYKPGQARVYASGLRDRQLIDETFDKLHEQGRLEWTKSHTPFSFPCFVVWKNTPDGAKGRVVVDIRALNKITVPDAYPIPIQADVLAEVAGCRFISTVDCASFFYQFLVRRDHRYRLTVASHRGQETFNCALMGYRNSPAHAQRTIDRILRKHRAYARAYIDDIVIFSPTLEEHLVHLDAVFSELSHFNICLSPKKSFLAYPSVQLLGQRVDALGLATDVDKLKAIAQLAFPRTLRQLEHYLGLTGYLRQYIPYYSGVTKPLQQRKAKLNQILRSRTSVAGNARKKEAARTRVIDPTTEEVEAFKLLQKLFTKPEILTHFDPSRLLHIDIDASSEFGFGAYAYHVKDNQSGGTAANGTPKQKSIQPILFLSKLLTPAEARYWPTELEVAALVWVVKKLRHLIEASHHHTVVYTDHQAIIDIAKQSSLNTTSVVRLNLRHVRSSEYLSRFRLHIRHKPGKSNIVPDALSRLPATAMEAPPTVAKARRHLMRSTLPHTGMEEELAYPIAVIELSTEFRARVRQAYNEDRQCARLLELLQDNGRLAENAATLPFVLHRRLLYFDDRQLGRRLVIPSGTIEQEIFQAAHDQHGHPGFARTHERVTQGFYLFNLAKKLKEYVAHCPDCQARRTPRHRPFGSLQPIISPSQPFNTISLDFILALPTSVPDRFDCALTVTDKFSKGITIVPGMTNWTGAQWAVALIDRLHLINWGVPQAIISDRDPKFIGQLWSTILERLGVRLIFTTAWHPSADGMSERTNQTIEIALRYLLATLDDHQQWPTMLARLSATLNNSTSRATGLTPTQVLYGRRIKEALDLARTDAELPILPLDSQPLATEHPVPVTRAGSAPPVVQPASTTAATALISNEHSCPDRSGQAYPIVPVNPTPYLPTHVDAKDAIALAAMTMKRQYDARHLPVFFQVGDWVSLRLHRGYTVPGLKDRNHKIEQQFAGPFEVIERVNRLAYRLRLPASMSRLHPVISIAHLEPARPPASDPYSRQNSEIPILTTDGRVNRQPERLLRRRDQRRRGGGMFVQYLVRYQGLGVEYDEWVIDRNLPLDMRQQYDAMATGQNATPTA